MSEESEENIRLSEQISQMMDENDETILMNQKLEYTLIQAKKKIGEMRVEIERLSTPPNIYASYLSMNEDGTAEVIANGRRMRCNVSVNINPEDLTRGRYLLMNDQMVALELGPYADAGEISKVVDVLDDGRLIIEGRMDERKIIYLREGLVVDDNRPLKAGDEVLVDPHAALALEYVYQDDAKDTLLEKVPDVTYDMIGGAEEAIEIVHDSVELPYKYPDVFAEFELEAPKGILLYGPPGCGKTMIAKAIANSLATKGGQAQFMNISGPELLTKWVGESERKIRELFQRAREAATPESPVVIFFDEMESLFRMRGSGRSSDMESTIVPTLLAELDGVEGLHNVLVIGATNRQDLVDPAVLRPGRLDIKIKLDRPNEEASTAILSKYLHAGLPLDGDVDTMIKTAVDYIFEETDDKRFLEISYSKGDRETLYFRDFISGAMLENIVSRAKKTAVKRHIGGEANGISKEDLTAAVDQEFKEAKDLPNTSDASDWGKITGRKGDEIVKVRSLVHDLADDKKGVKVEDHRAGGQYL